MLVVHPTSTCDVCLEGYTGGSENIPYSISCGHVFCLGCLQSLRQHICPLCRSPFDSSGVRRLHVDRNDQQPSGSARTPSPRRADNPRSELHEDNALGLFDDIPRAAQLQNKITDLVLQSSFASRVREGGVRELIQEVHSFLNSEPLDKHPSLRAPFILLYRFAELQRRYQQLESSSFDLRSESNRDKQLITDWERKYQDLKRSRAYDQETARNVEDSLRERLRIEELEWQRKYDFVTEECTALRDEVNELRFSSKLRNAAPSPPRSAFSTQMYFLDVEEGPKSGRSHDELKASTGRKEVGFSGEVDDMYSLFNPDIFRISPVPECAPLNASRSSSDSEDEAAVEKKKLKQRSLAPPSPPSSLSGSVSRASDSAAALKLSPNMVAIPISSAAPGRPRSDSSPFRISTRDASRSPKEQEREASSSVPKSYMYRDVPHSLFPPTPKPPQAAGEVHERKTPEVMRLYSLLEKPVPTVDSRFEPGTDSMNSRGSGHEETSRPTLLRSSSFHQTHTSSQPAPSISSPPAYFRPHGLRQAQTYVQAQAQPSLLSASQPRLNVQTQPQTQFQLQSQPQGQDQALSPVQRTPPRPVLPHLHSFSFYNPAKPASPQENRVRAIGTLPRRGSLSSASAAAAAAQSQSHPQVQPGPRVREAKSGTSTNGVPAIVPPSSLWSGRPHAGGLYERQESD